MVYTSRPDYLDPPNWSQQLQTHQLIQQANQTGRNGGSAGASSGSDPHNLLHHAPVQPRSDGGAAGLVRAGSMVDRARMAKIPLPEHNLKCPRCDSTNTKFCYFNNYSLSQPRHFCKTCRRYWTRGGALRNVPVGGGCRRSKRSKSGAASKSTSNDGKSGPTGSITHAPQLGSGDGGAITTSGFVPPPQLPLLASLHPLSDYGAVQSIGLNYPIGIHQIDHTDYPVQNTAGSVNPMALDHWRPLHQFPCFSDLEAAPPPLSTGLYAFNAEAGGDAGATPASLMSPGQIQAKPTCSSLATQLASVKMEEGNPQGSNIPRQYLSLPPLGNNDPYWGGVGVTGGGGLATGIMAGGSGTSGVAWTDISGISSTSAGSLL